jgi:acetyl esterase/lipase
MFLRGVVRRNHLAFYGFTGEDGLLGVSMTVKIFAHSSAKVGYSVEPERFPLIEYCANLFNLPEAQCVVITVDYRLAPEHPYPAAVEDALESLRWVQSSGAKQFNLDVNRIAVGGTSAGSNLATVLCLMAVQLNIRICYQLLIVPVIDNTATVDDIWKENRNAPWLTPTRMTWYRRMYMPNEADWGNWLASPQLAPEELLKQLPPTWMAVSEQDLLAPEAHSFFKQLSSLEVPVTLYEVHGGTHSILALCGVLSSGKQMIEEAAQILKSALE